MHCHEAQNLFDAYLDGELTPEQAAELGAHRLRCASCRQALALQEVTRDVISVDSAPTRLRADFSDRLLACVAERRSRWSRRLRLGVYYGTPLTAAALIALAFLGAFDQSAKVAGEVKPVLPVPVIMEVLAEEPGPALPEATAPAADRQSAAMEDAFSDWIDQTRSNLDAKRQSGDAVNQKLDLTIIQLLDILDSLQKEGGAPHYPGADEAPPPADQPAGNREAVEDL